MQQTQNYRLNKPETSDPFSPEPLSRNMDTVDAALADVSRRVVALENCRVLIGTYHGTGDELIIDLGERPAAVLVCIVGINVATPVFVAGDFEFAYNGRKAAKLTDSGLWVNGFMSEKYYNYTYLALLGGWPARGFPEAEA